MSLLLVLLVCTQVLWSAVGASDPGLATLAELVESSRYEEAIGWFAGANEKTDTPDEVAVFEPTHGSAPKYQELDPPIVNPIAMILSAAMMLDHVGEEARAARVRAAVAAGSSTTKIASCQ